MRLRLQGPLPAATCMTRVPHLLLAGVDGQGDLGDEAAVGALITGLRERLPDARLMAVAADEQRTRDAFEVQTVPASDWALIAAALRGSDLLVLAPGRPLSEDDAFEPERLLEDGACGLAHTAGLALLATTLGRPYVLVSPATTAARRAETQATVGAVEGAAAWSVTCELAATVRPCSPRRTAEILEAASLPCQVASLVAVIVPARDCIPRATAAALNDFLRVADARLLLIPSRCGGDAVSLERALGQFPAGRAHALRAGLLPSEVAAVLGRCELVVTASRSVAGLAAAGGAPAVLVTPVDIRGAGLAATAVPLTDNTDAMARGLVDAWTRRGELRGRVLAAIAAVTSSARLVLDTLVDRLGRLSSSPTGAPPELLLVPAVSGLVKRARVTGLVRERERRQHEVALVELHRDLAGQVEDRDRAVRGLQAELHAKVGERDRIIRELQHELLTKVGERDRLIQELQTRLTESEGGR